MYTLQHEVSICKKDQPFEIRLRRESVLEESPASPPSEMETDQDAKSSQANDKVNDGASTSAAEPQDKLVPQNPVKTGNSVKG